MAKNEIPKVSEKNTKAELMEAFNKVVAELETKSQTVIDPMKEATIKATSAVVGRVENVNQGAIENTLNIFASNLKKLQDELSIYNEVQLAINIKKAELKEMFDIEKSAYTLAALINTQNALQENFEKATAERKALASNDLLIITKQIEEEKAKFHDEIKRLTEERDAKRKKDQAEYDYNILRERKLADDKFQDEMNAKKKALALEIEKDKKEIAEADADLSARESKIESRETEIADMENKIAQFPTILEAAIKKAESDGQKTASTSYAFETRYIKKEYEGEVALLKNKIETLEKALADSNARNEVISTKLDEAYNKLETLAAKTVDGASNAKLVSTLETALRDKGTTTSK